MLVRIYFRGLILFRFPTKGKDNGKLVAELITALPPPSREVAGGARAKALQQKDQHDAEIQVVTGADAERDSARRKPRSKRKGANSPSRDRTRIDHAEMVKALPPTPLFSDARVEISVPGCEGRVRRAPSFWHHVPSIGRMADMMALQPTVPEEQKYVRNTVVINGGKVRVKDVVIWDTGFPLEKNVRDAPSAPAVIKFMGVDYLGHAANECVVEFENAKKGVIIESKQMDFGEAYVSLTGRSQLAPEKTVEVMFRNYEYQRDKPVPWGMDFQLMFKRLGYAPLGSKDLDREEMRNFEDAARKARFGTLLNEDKATLWDEGKWWPFPYIVSNASLTSLSPLTGTKSRPLCVSGSTP